MLENLITTTAVIILGMALYRFWPQIAKRLKRFDDENRARIEQEQHDRADGIAHFRHTLKIAEEQVEDIVELDQIDPRTATPAKRYVFEGEQFASRREAERVREEKVRALARTFYMELPAALAARKGDGKLGRT